MRNLKTLSKTAAQDATALALAAYPAPTTTDIDNAVVSILGGDETVQDVYQESYEAEKHLHNYERWFGKSADQSGTNWGEESSLTPYQSSSNSGDFGTGIKLLGPTDTPVQSGNPFFDLHRLLVSDMSSNVAYILRIIEDLDGDGDADTPEGKGYYTDIMAIPDDTNTNRAGGYPTELIDKRAVAGVSVWAKVKATGSVDIDFFIGVHEYEQ